MGVPKFYRWLSERYPCLSQVIKEHQIPEFDNLYLDMNGIIHPCSHPNDDDPHFRITEAQIFKNIFNYVEVLFRIIKPKKNFFMAVDGCAPRAKMNQQRSRRFRTAKDAEDNIRKAVMKGHNLPTTERFDSNCITPGTEFMAKLQEQLKYFVNKKISTDSLWQNCTIYLSGHDVPGEGEHKIMDFIRYCKSKPGYDANTRHCLYGLDADLIILGLVTHEPHFALLREEVRYGKNAKRMIQPEEQTFHLLHLSLLREYVDFEFHSIKPDIHFVYNLERIIDDWVILGFLVGNDFVPHLPNLHINHDALPYLFGIYKEYLVSADGYVNDGGELNIHRLKKFFEILSKFDRNQFEDIYADLKWLESKNMLHNKDDGETPTKRFSELLSSLSDQDDSPNKSYNPYSAIGDVSGIDDFYCGESPQKAVTKKQMDDNDEDVEVEDDETFELEFKQHKRHYYMEKFDMDIVDDDVLRTICYEYVRALQWISHYYFNGLQSWSWYYPYHYSPYVSDVAALEMREIKFDKAKPFHPFEQLLAVLPAASRKLLPDAFQNLMVDENSPIIDFYPPDFRTDLNGKQQDWEAVVLIPFINENRLMNAMHPNYSRLTDEEKGRNSFGDCFKYKYDKTLNFMYRTSFFGVFDDVTVCKAKVENIPRDQYRIDMLQIKKGLLGGVMLNTYYHGFPTMKHLKVTPYLKKAAVKVFQQASRNDNMIVKIHSPPETNMESLSKRLVGEIVFVEWPYMVEALVTSICNDSIRYYLDEKDELVSKLIKGDEYNQIKSEMKVIANQLIGRRGVELGQVLILVEAKLLLGQRYICAHNNGSVRLEKEWKATPAVYPYQTVVQNLQVYTTDVEVCDSVVKLYPPGSLVFMMSPTHYGCCGEVTEIDQENCRVRVALKVTPEPDYSEIIRNFGSLSVHYIPDRTIAQRLSISTNLLGRITGNVYVVPDSESDEEPNQNIGLKLKYSGQNKEVLGFARRTDSGWTYSPTTISILKEYMRKFPEIFESLGRTANQERYLLSTLVRGKTNAYLDEIKTFLRSQKCYDAQPVRCGSNILDHPIVEEIKNALDKAKSSVGEKKVVKVRVKPHLLFRPTEHFGKLSPDPETEFLLFDRVVNIQYGISVPIGLRGTIIGFHDVLTVENDKESPTEIRYEVLFDESFLADKGESSLMVKRGYFVSGYSLLNISYGHRKENEKNGVPLSSPSSFQNKISHGPISINAPNSSPYGSRTPGSGSSQGTPKSYQSPTYGNQRGNYSAPSYRNSNNKNENLVSPDYWVKGHYGNKNNNFSTPQPQPRRQILQNNGGNQQKRYPQNDKNDFLNMWTELQKNENAAIKNSTCNQSMSENTIDKNATAMLQQMLKIKDQPSNSPSQQTAQHPPPQSNLSQHTPSPQHTPSQHSSSPYIPSQHNPSPQHKSLPNQFPLQGTSSQHSITKSFQTPPFTSVSNQSPSPQHSNTGSQPATMFTNRSPKSPYNNMTRPPLLNMPPQANMQNMFASMPPGQGYIHPTHGTYSLFGIPPNTSTSPVQSATIFQQLMGNPSMPNMQYPYPVLPQQVQGVSPISQGVSPLNFPISPAQMGHHVSSYQFPSPMVPTRDFYQTPRNFYSNRQGFQTPNQFARGSRSYPNAHTKQSWNDNQPKQCTPETSSNEKLKAKANPFIPHQVLMKNSSLLPSPPLQSDPESEIKGILGIKDKNSEQKIMSVQKPSTADSECVKNILDLKPLSDDDKLKNLLGINATSLKGVDDGSCRKRNGDSSKEKHSSENVLCNATPYNAAATIDVQRRKNTPPTMAAVENQHPDDKKKPQILLAPSFFGPKKKSSL